MTKFLVVIWLGYEGGTVYRVEAPTSDVAAAMVEDHARRGNVIFVVPESAALRLGQDDWMIQDLVPRD